MKKASCTLFFHHTLKSHLLIIRNIKNPNNQMAKQSMPLISIPNRWPLFILLVFTLSTTIAFILRASFSNSCNDSQYDQQFKNHIHSDYQIGIGNGEKNVNYEIGSENPLSFMKSKLVLMVSHELSLSGGPLLLMELAFLLRNVNTEVVWVTNQKPNDPDEVIYSLEQRMLEKGLKVLPAKDSKVVDTALKADLVILNTAVAGKWLDAVLKENVPHVLPKVLWWIHEMRGHYFKLEYVKHLPFVAGAMIDSHTTVEYWKNRTRERLGIKMPQTYAVHLGNSKELMNVADDIVARRVLREHVRELLGVRKEDLLFAIINSVSRGKGQDLFLRAFHESLQIIQEKKLKVPVMHAVVVGSDMSAQTKFETELRNFVAEKKIQARVHFVNKTLNVAPYLASIDVLVQNSQGRGECFGRITIEAMAFKIPVLGTAAGGTTEIVVNDTTGILHPAGKEGVTPLAQNIVELAADAERRRIMGEKGYERVKDTFLEKHMSHRISLVLKQVLHKSNLESPWEVYEVSCGAFHTALLTHRKRPSDTLTSVCWTFGLGDNGQLGHGITKSYLSPEPVSGLPESIFLISVACGLFHTCAVSSAGEVWSWGMEKGLGLCPDASFNRADSGDAVSPLYVPCTGVYGPRFPEPLLVSCGAAHTVLVADAGYKLWSWGRGRSGVLGNGKQVDCITPTIAMWPPLIEDFKENEPHNGNGDEKTEQKSSKEIQEMDKRLSNSMEEMKLLRSKYSVMERYASILHGSIFGRPFQEQDIPASLQSSGTFDIAKEWENMLESSDRTKLHRLEMFYRTMTAGIKDKLMKKRIQEIVKECLHSEGRNK